MDSVSVYFSLALFAVMILISVNEAHYLFRNDADRELCENSDLVEITPYRSVSTVVLGWLSAISCCQLKGRILHTIERSDESAVYPLKEILLNKVGESPTQTQSKFWIAVHLHQRSHYQWGYGTDLRYVGKQLTRDVYKWAEEIGTPDPNTSPNCVLIRVVEGSEILELIPEACEKPLQFICQRIERRGGEPLRGSDVMSVGSVQFFDIPGFERLKYASLQTRWSVANAICQSQDWALIDHVHDRFGEALIVEIMKNRKLYLFDKNVKAIHTSGNDFCHPHKWEWICGDHTTTIPFYKNCTNRKPELDKLYHHTERCVQFLIPPEPENNIENLPPLVAVNADCDEIGYVICDSRPACKEEKYYPCLRNEPNYVDLEENLAEDVKNCENAKFTMVTPNNSDVSFQISATQFTWKGAEQCCKSKGWSLPTPYEDGELDELNEVILKNISAICSSKIKCDGFWSGATTIDADLLSPLLFPDGKELPSSMYSYLRADINAYPSCGRINFMNLEETQVEYVHAHCLEKNFLVCDESASMEDRFRRRASEAANLEGRKSKKTGKGGGKFNQINSEEENYFDREKFKRFFDPLHPIEKELKHWDKNRDTCSDPGMQQNYRKSCPSSSSTLSFNKQSQFLNSSTKNQTENDPVTNILFLVKHQNRILLEQLVNGGMTASTEAIEEYPYAFQFLKQLITLYSQTCPLVPFRFTEKAIENFRMLYLSLYPEPRPEIMQDEDFRWTTNILNRCVDLAKPSKLMNDLCAELVVAKNCNCSDFICTETKFESKLYKADLLMDVVWKVFEAAYAICFPAFTQNMLLHHKFAMTMVDLWENQGLRTRWSHQIQDQLFWTRLLGPRFETHLVNMERCNAANIELSYYKVRLSPSSMPTSARISGVPYGKF